MTIGRIIGLNFSADNRYAQEYLNARHKYDDARYQVVHAKPRSKAQYLALLDKRDYWEKKLTQLSFKANEEETKIKTRDRAERQDTLEKHIDYMA